MTLRYSNSGFITVTEAAPLENIGWTLQILAESDYATVIAQADRFLELNYSKEYNDVGGGGVTLELDDRIFTDPLPAGQTVPIREQQALYQIFHNAVLRGEFFAEDIDEDVLDPDFDTRTCKIGGRGTASVLERAQVLPLGMPAPTTLNRTYTGNIMAFWLTLLNEAKARGTITYVNPQFTATQDSSGTNWTDNQTITVSAGDDLLTLLQKWCEALGKRWYMAPGFKLYVYPEEGNHKEMQVSMTVYADQQQATRKSTRKEIANYVAVQAGDKGVAVATDSASIARWGRREEWLSAGDAGDVGTAQIVANATAKIRADQVTQRSFQVPFDRPGKLVFKDYDVGDWIGVEIQDFSFYTGTPESKHVAAISIKVDNANQTTCEITLESKFEVRARRLQRIIDKLGGSNVGGGSTNQGSAQLPVTFNDLGNTKLVQLSDVAVSGVALNQFLVWNGTKWANQSVVIPTSIQALQEAIGIDIVSNTVTASNSAFATKGNIVRASVTGVMEEVYVYGNWVTGTGYKIGLYEVTDPAVTPIVAVIGEQTFSGPAGTGLRYASVTGMTWGITIGKLYMVAVIDTTSGTAATPVGTLASMNPIPGGGVSVLKTFATVANVNPTVGTALTLTKTGVGYCINTRVRPA